MFRHSLPLSVALACLAFAGATPAHAVIETWVSGTGTDAGNCPRSAPCRTFAYALTKTNNGGAINVATSGSFGPVTINKSVSIVADGVEALINTANPTTEAAITVQAAASHVVSLRGLTIVLASDQDTGILFSSGAVLHVQNCVIHGGGDGITTDTAGTFELYIADTVIRKSGNNGVRVLPTGSASARVTLERVHLEKSINGIFATASQTSGSVHITLADSVVTGAFQYGIWAIQASSGSTQVMVDRTAIVNNNAAGVAATGATVRIGDSTVTGNTVGLREDGGEIESYGTNKVDGNGTDTLGTITTIDMK